MAAIAAAPHTIEIEMQPAEGWLLRVIGLVERRGFEVVSVNAETAIPGRPARLTLSASPRGPERRIDVLQAQLRRLHGVVDVRGFETGAQLEAAS